jgi:drug/metabolite transporter (DMT)-like permease
MSATTSRGILLMFGANITFTIMAGLVRVLADFNSYTTTLFRFFVGIMILCTLAMSGRISLSFVNTPVLFLRGLTGGISTALVFFSIGKLGLIKTGFIFNTYPVFAAVFGVIFLRESVSRVKWIALLGALSGMFLLLHDSNSTHAIALHTGKYELFAITGTILAGLTIVIIKKLHSTDSTSAIFFAQCLVGICIVAVPASVGTLQISPLRLFVLLMIGILATAGQLMLTRSYRFISISTGSLIVMTGPLFNCLAGLTVFHEALTIPMAIGAVIMLAASATALFLKE